MSDVAIKVDNVSKTFKLPHEKTGSIKNAFTGLFSGKRTYEKQEVLKDISFEIKKGEFFGIVGRNGSGKSTLLKLMAGIYSPDQGAIQVNGKLTPFIELGVGFNPELTGRENVYLNGALLGFNRTEIGEMYDEIVGFSELENFMDQKLKNYSSGMQVRLAFSIAIRAKSEILVLDEVLAVGDERFQNKCLAVFNEIKKSGRTVVFVSHDMSSVKKFCDQAVVLHKGEYKFKGNAEDAATEYIKLNFPEMMATEDRQDSTIQVRMNNSNGQKIKERILKTGDEVGLDISWSNKDIVKNAGVAILRDDGQYIFGTNTIVDNYKIRSNHIRYKVKLSLGEGTYHFQLGLFGDSDTDKISFIDRALSFKVVNAKGWQGSSELSHSWEG